MVFSLKRFALSIAAMIVIVAAACIGIMFFWNGSSIQRKCLPCLFVPTQQGPESFDNCLCAGNPAAINSEVLKQIEFNRSGKAFIFADSGWMLVDTNGRIVLSGVANMENGPDEPKNGLLRFSEKGKWGYADTDGNVVISPQFDGALPFNDGAAVVCVGCSSKADGEHHFFDGGKSFSIDTNGREIVDNETSRRTLFRQLAKQWVSVAKIENGIEVPFENQYRLVLNPDSTCQTFSTPENYHLVCSWALLSDSSFAIRLKAMEVFRIIELTDSTLFAEPTWMDGHPLIKFRACDGSQSRP